MAKRKKVTHKFHTRKYKGKLEMVCRNSIEDTSYWAWPKLSGKPRCYNYSEVSEDSTAVLCWKCVCQITPPPEIKGGYVSKGRPRGWQFMKEFIDKDGNVFYKGKEQPDLKGTLPPTKPKPKSKKPKLSKAQKANLKRQAMITFHKLKKSLAKAKTKKAKKEIQREIRKIEKIIK